MHEGLRSRSRLSTAETVARSIEADQDRWAIAQKEESPIVYKVMADAFGRRR